MFIANRYIKAETAVRYYKVSPYNPKRQPIPVPSKFLGNYSRKLPGVVLISLARRKREKPKETS